MTRPSELNAAESTTSLKRFIEPALVERGDLNDVTTGFNFDCSPGSSTPCDVTPE